MRNTFHSIRLSPGIPDFDATLLRGLPGNKAFFEKATAARTIQRWPRNSFWKANDTTNSA
jgi:hypothetical protein